MGFCLIRCEVSINSVHDWRHLIGSKYQRAFAVTCEICLMFALSYITRINLKRHRVCPEIARSNVYFQLEASLIVKCMAWPLCRGENEWPGGRFLGRHSKHVLRNADLSFTSFTLRPPPLRTSELPFYFRENPTCLLHLQGRSRNTLRRQSMYDVKECLSAEWRVPFNFLPVRSFLGWTPGRCQRAAEAGRASLIRPFMQQGPQQRFSVTSGSTSIHSPLQAMGKYIGNSIHINVHKAALFPQFCCQESGDAGHQEDCGTGAFLQGLSFFLLLLHHPFKT